MIVNLDKINSFSQETIEEARRIADPLLPIKKRHVTEMKKIFRNIAGQQTPDFSWRVSFHEHMKKGKDYIVLRTSPRISEEYRIPAGFKGDITHLYYTIGAVYLQIEEKDREEVLFRFSLIEGDSWGNKAEVILIALQSIGVFSLKHLFTDDMDSFLMKDKVF
jgi:hypothetical protein